MHVWIWLLTKCSIIRDIRIWGTRKANIWILSVEDPCLISLNFSSVRRIIKPTIFNIIIFFRRMLCKIHGTLCTRIIILHLIFHTLSRTEKRQARSMYTIWYTLFFYVSCTFAYKDYYHLWKIVKYLYLYSILYIALHLTARAQTCKDIVKNFL